MSRVRQSIQQSSGKQVAQGTGVASGSAGSVKTKSNPKPKPAKKGNPHKSKGSSGY